MVEQPLRIHEITMMITRFPKDFKKSIQKIQQLGRKSL